MLTTADIRISFFFGQFYSDQPEVALRYYRHVSSSSYDMLVSSSSSYDMLVSSSSSYDMRYDTTGDCCRWDSIHRRCGITLASAASILGNLTCDTNKNKK